MELEPATEVDFSGDFDREALATSVAQPELGASGLESSTSTRAASTVHVSGPSSSEISSTGASNNNAHAREIMHVLLNKPAAEPWAMIMVEALGEQRVIRHVLMKLQLLIS